jgi:hypothetical protein
MGEINSYSVGRTYNVLSDASSSTGTTSSTEVILKSLSWTVGQFDIGDVVNIEAAFSKQGTAGGYFHAVYYNTDNNLTNARKVFESSVNPTDNSIYIPSGLTYSNLFCRLQVVLNDNSIGGTFATFAKDPNRSYARASGVSPFGGDGTYSTTTDLHFSSTNVSGSSPFGFFWQKIGTTEGLTSIEWTPPGAVTRYIHFTGAVENSSDRLRCEWAKISGLSSGSFDNSVSG